MSNITRKISLFLIFISIIQLCSCGVVVINHDKIFGTGDSSDPSSAETTGMTKNPEVTYEVIENDYEDEISANLKLIDDIDYNGAVFKITSPDDSSFNGNGNVEFLSEAAEKRNQYVADKHNMSIVASKVDNNEYYNEVNTAVKSGMYYADLLVIPQDSVCSFAAGNLILNMRSMSGMDFGAPYFNKSSVGAAAGGFNSYAVAGPASVYPYSLPAVFFNRGLAEATGNDLYSLASKGEWTWDKFFEVAVSAASNENHFSWGTTNMDEAVYETAFVSCGNSMIESGIMQVPKLAFDAETSSAAVDVVKRLYSADSTIRVNSSAGAYFNEGNGYFYFEKLSSLNDMRGSKVNWGILPMPKASADGEYFTLAGKNSLMFACPATVSTPEKSATILMSLNAASEGIINDAYIKYVQYNYLRDNDSANMLELILRNVVYDFSYTYGDRYGEISNGTYNMIRRAALPEETMDSLIGRYKGNLDRALAVSFGLSN